MLDKGNLLKMKTTKRKTIKLMTKSVKESQDDLQKHIITDRTLGFIAFLKYWNNNSILPNTRK